MLFSFKKHYTDFVVEEILPFALQGRGDACYVYIEKKNMTTMDVLHHLRKGMKLQRKQIGIAGLKDKDALTRQWLCVYKRVLQRHGGLRKLLEVLQQKVRVIEQTRHPTPLQLSTPIINHFALRLRAKQQLSQDIKPIIEQTLNSFAQEGLPNFFGDQRFGVNKRNIAQAKRIIAGSFTPDRAFDTIFKLQAYSSFLFNQYINSRRNRTKKNQTLALWEGDIVQLSESDTGYGVFDGKDIYHLRYPSSSGSHKPFWVYPSKGKRAKATCTRKDLTGPVPGFNTLLVSPESKAGEHQKKFMTRHQIDPQYLSIYKRKRLYGRRRKLWMEIHQFRQRWDGDDLLIQFDLESGCYASILIDELFSRIHSTVGNSMTK